jgi:hypothetical protein
VRRVQAGLFHGFTIHVDRIARVVPAHVAERVVKDREQPCLQVRAALELICRAEGLQIRVLHEILGFRRPSRQPQGGAVEAVQVRQRLGRECLVGGAG